MRRSTCWIAAIALAAASAPAGANDLVRVAGEIQPEGGVDIGDVVAGLRAIAGFRVLTDAEKLTANVYPCVPVDLGGADPSPHPPPCTPTPGFLFDLNDVGVILDAWRGALYIAPTRGYQQQKAGTLNGTSSEALFLGGTERPDVTFADYDGDGDLELLSIGAENAMRWWRNPGVTSPDLLEWDG
ncbi:MAG: hypothetical protein KC466_01590, partial [Myxococcales bacterium]|nr:hypothetical protein [Myxococcales bacterium]